MALDQRSAFTLSHTCSGSTSWSHLYRSTAAHRLAVRATASASSAGNPPPPAAPTAKPANLDSAVDRCWGLRCGPNCSTRADSCWGPLAPPISACSDVEGDNVWADVCLFPSISHHPTRHTPMHVLVGWIVSAPSHCWPLLPDHPTATPACHCFPNTWAFTCFLPVPTAARPNCLP